MKDEALKLALETLECWQRNEDCNEPMSKILEAIKEALAQPEQEPVAKVTSETGDPDITMSWWHEPALPVGTKLYTTPPQRKPLRSYEIAQILDRERMKWNKSPPTHEFDLAFVRAIEAAHGIKE